MMFRNSFIKRWKIFIPIMIGIFINLLFLTFIFKEDVKRDETYTDKKDVVLYIKKYHELPRNYITKNGRDYYYNNGISLDGYIVGGDTHFNDGKLSSLNIDSDTMLKECDVYYEGYSCVGGRGSYRLVYETNKKGARVFYTEDHYDSFDEIRNIEIMPLYYIFLVITVFYAVSCSIFLLCIYIPEVNKRLEEKKNNKIEE